MKHWKAFLAGAICILSFCGCSSLNSYLEIAQEKGMSREYQAIFQKWTRSQIIYSQFETKVRIEATYQSPEFKKAYFDENARISQFRPEERKVREEIRASMASDQTEFVFYAYTPDKRSNDFDRQGSIWSVFLVTGSGEKIYPVEIRKMDPVTPVHTGFFPYITPSYVFAYWLRFRPIDAAGLAPGSVKLVFTSVIGKVELDFGNPG